MAEIKLINGDCMEGMKHINDALPRRTGLEKGRVMEVGDPLGLSRLNWIN